MRVYGEVYFLINGWMDYLCLLLTASLGRRRLRADRAVPAAFAGAAYAVAAWMGPSWLRSAPAVIACAVLMTAAALGRDGLRLWPLTLAMGLFFSGLTDALLQERVGVLPGMALCGGAALGLSWAAKRTALPPRGAYRLRVTVNRQSVQVPALRDSGNLLRDGATGLPVIVAPEALLRPLLPAGVRSADLSTLPPGWHLTRARTAAGSACLMCFFPDNLTLSQGRRSHRVQAAVALSDFSSPRALLPEAIFSQEGKDHASL